ncbi:MAG: hypothetical protein SNJ75_12465, partial [Gemmataceae bacterium]
AFCQARCSLGQQDSHPDRLWIFLSFVLHPAIQLVTRRGVQRAMNVAERACKDANRGQRRGTLINCRGGAGESPTDDSTVRHAAPAPLRRWL